jgi:GH15 family glucan-1,4-alpha-glucosidase
MRAATSLRARLAGEAPTPELGELVPSRTAEPYRPIRDYALIGDCHGAALVARDGGIDWCCIGRFDADPLFTRLLDAGQGGYFDLCPEAPFAVHRRYRPRTNILETEFATGEGRVRLVDFMPVGRRAGRHDYLGLSAPGWIVRRVTGIAGRVPMRMRCRLAPRFGAAAAPAAQRPSLYATLPLESGSIEQADFSLCPRESALFVLAPSLPQNRDLSLLAHEMERASEAFWEEWLGFSSYRGPYQKPLRRSALALKLMSYAPTGALVAAPTTSLPEAIGGGRNWDYRYCWLRDGAFTLYALAGMGFTAEAHAFVEFLRGCQFERRAARLMYGIAGETALDERILEDMEGYRGSGPVRIGNAAHAQAQHDMFGEVLDLALLYRTLGGNFDGKEEVGLASLADQAAQCWREPDHSIWEMRTEPKHFTYSKIMCWVALDRAIRLFGRRAAWQAARDEILQDVLAHGLDPSGDHLAQHYGADGTDAALLIVPWTGFPLGRALLHRTVSAVIRELREGDYVRRYRGDDGLPGNEGCFLMCSFWLVDALLYLDHPEQARALFERLLSRASDLGLFAEEIDSTSHAFLGNYPQALAHLALVNSALRLDLYRRHGRKALEGSHADRARWHVASTHGLGARLGRLRRRLLLSQGWIGDKSVLPLP